MRHFAQPVLKALLLLGIASACFACAKQDFSGDNELAKSQTPGGQAATTAKNGASVHAAMMTPPPRKPQ